MIFNGLEMINNMELISCIQNIKECIEISKTNIKIEKVEESLKTYSPQKVQAINERVIDCLKKNKDNHISLSRCFDSILKDILIT